MEKMYKRQTTQYSMPSLELADDVRNKFTEFYKIYYVLKYWLGKVS